MAIGVLIEAAEQGLAVPDDLSVVGFDGIEAAAWTQPGLTTIEQPIADIARDRGRRAQEPDRRAGPAFARLRLPA